MLIIAAAQSGLRWSKWGVSGKEKLQAIPIREGEFVVLVDDFLPVFLDDGRDIKILLVEEPGRLCR